MIDDAGQRADRQREVLPNEQGEGAPTAERAEQVRRSYLGLTLAAAEDKAAQEDRRVRVTARDAFSSAATTTCDPAG